MPSQATPRGATPKRAMPKRAGQRPTGGRGRGRSRARFLAALAAVAVFTAACESEPPPPLGTVGYVGGFVGRVAADDPLGVQVAREVLSAGGTAADAAVALYFTLAVTLPSRASIGGGGLCLVRDNPTHKTQTLLFLPRVSASGAGGNKVPVAVPGNPRGMFALHSRYGRLLWEQLLAPAENLARAGHQVSPALADDLHLAAGQLAKNKEARRIFGRKGGGMLRQGDMLVQPDLAVLLSDIRTRGPGDFYDGMLAPALVRRFKEAAGTSKGAVRVNDLREYQPEWLGAVSVPMGGRRMIYFPPRGAGLVAAQMWQMLRFDDLYAKTPPKTRGHLLAEVSMRAFADRARWMESDGESKLEPDEVISEARVKDLMKSYNPDTHTPAATLTPKPHARPENPAATGFVVVDREGSAVACTVTMNNLFGLGRVARGTGIMLATAPVKGNGTAALLAAVAADPGSGEFLLAATASGGAAAPTALTTVLLGVLKDEESLPDALAAKRLHHSGLPDVVLYEKGESQSRVKMLTNHGHKVFQIGSLGLVEAVSCPGGLPKDPDSCQAGTDPRGAGVALNKDD